MSPPKARRPITKATAPGRKRTNADRLAEKVREGQRQAARKPCKTCGADTLVGLDDDRCAMTVTVDARAVSVVEELDAYVHERPSYLVRYRDARAELTRRDPIAIRADPLPPHPVVLEHRCSEWPAPAPDPFLF